MKQNLYKREAGYKRILFFLFFLIPVLAFSQSVDYGKNYFNVTKGVTGGTVEPGDTIQVRATFVVRSGAIADSCAFYDAIPSGTAYISGSLCVLTNEGKTYKTFTDTYGDDAGWVSGSNVTIHLGYNASNNPATAFRRGQVRASHRPSFYGSTCIMMASYSVRVLASYGSTINLGNGTATYKLGAASIQVISFASNPVAIFANNGVCSNSVGGNSLGAEFNGTFGSGAARNRSASASVPASYTYQYFTTGSPQDYYYGIPNNTSTLTNYTTSNAWAKPDASSPTHRVHTVWDIIGDHTGASNPLLGNSAADTVANPNAGYMVIINASYKTDSAFQHTITGLCPNTYYELSAWFRNVCSRCGCDSAGRGASTAGYIPTATGDSSGVYPSLTVEVNGTDYYSTGQIRYTGQWIKKGFTYLTGPAETSFTLTIRNNAPGGGGNDWAIDDISVATCTPNLDLQPSPTVNVCYGNTVDMYTVVRCYYSNYIYWRWEKSTDGGSSWTNTGVSGTGSPTLVSGEWQYTASYPTFLGDSANHNVLYRIRVASTSANLDNESCSFTASTTIRVFVNSCGFVLKTHLLSLNGKVINDKAQLNWIAENEDADLIYEIEKSTDGIHFTKAGVVNSLNNPTEKNAYIWNDYNAINGSAYYRIKMVTADGFKYSKIIFLSNNKLAFEIKAVVNPFNETLFFDAISPVEKTILITVNDSYGRKIKEEKRTLSAGINKINIGGLGYLPEGTYLLRVQADESIFNKKVIKRKY